MIAAAHFMAAKSTNDIAVFGVDKLVDTSDLAHTSRAGSFPFDFQRALSLPSQRLVQLSCSLAKPLFSLAKVQYSTATSWRRHM